MAIIRFSIKPTLTISPILTLPDEKIMALGGVATGSMNAIDADMVAGIMRNANTTTTPAIRTVNVMAIPSRA